MKISICYEFKENHGGGGTSVLENLRKYFIKNELYVNDKAKADIIIFNSFHSINEIINLKRKYPKALFIHRIDGPMGVYNTPLDLRDEFVFLLNKYIADATIFQTQWSKKACELLGLNTFNQPTQTIINAPDSSIFKKKERALIPNQKLKIFYSSWSTNTNKGFDTLEWLDKNLNWEKFEFNFAGRTKVPFENIKNMGSLTKKEIAEELYSSHVFLFASKFDPCSNSLAEAIATGIPIISFDGGGSPELLPENSYTYQKDIELKHILETIRKEYSHLNTSMEPLYTYTMMTTAYVDFLKKCLSVVDERKPFDRYDRFLLKVKILFIRVLGKFKPLSRIHGFITGKHKRKVEIQHKNRGILYEN